MVPIYLAALAAQLGFDLASALTRETLAHRQAPRQAVGAISPAYLVDVLLAPIGLLAAFAAVGRPYALLLLLFPCALLAVLARDRKHRANHTLELGKRHVHASREARQDPLTGLANRRVWEEALLASSRGHRHTDRPTSVIFIDLDQLKTANDSYGHTVGDQLIRELATLLTTTIRSSGLVARIGGDEFGILLPGINELECQKIIHRLRTSIHNYPGIGPLPLTASIGHASTPPATSLEHAIQLADTHMYKEKHGNRPNRQRQTRPAELAAPHAP